MSKVVIYSKELCPYCTSAKQAFAERGIEYEEIVLDSEGIKELKKQTKFFTVPQIFVNDTFIGGYTELMASFEDGKFDELYQQ